MPQARERNEELLHRAIGGGRIVPGIEAKFQPAGADTVVLEHSGCIEELRARFVFVFHCGESPGEFLRRAGIQVTEKVVAA